MTNWSFVVLIVLIIFRKQIGDHFSLLFKEVVNLISRINNVKRGETEISFTPAELKSLASENNALILQNALLNITAFGESDESDDAELTETTALEADEIEAMLAKIKSQQERGNDK